MKVGSFLVKWLSKSCRILMKKSICKRTNILVHPTFRNQLNVIFFRWHFLGLGIFTYTLNLLTELSTPNFTISIVIKSNQKWRNEIIVLHHSIDLNRVRLDFGCLVSISYHLFGREKALGWEWDMLGRPAQTFQRLRSKFSNETFILSLK